MNNNRIDTRWTPTVRGGMSGTRSQSQNLNEESSGTFSKLFEKTKTWISKIYNEKENNNDQVLKAPRSTSQNVSETIPEIATNQVFIKGRSASTMLQNNKVPIKTTHQSKFVPSLLNSKLTQNRQGLLKKTRNLQFTQNYCIEKLLINKKKTSNEFQKVCLNRTSRLETIETLNGLCSTFIGPNNAKIFFHSLYIFDQYLNIADFKVIHRNQLYIFTLTSFFISMKYIYNSFVDLKRLMIHKKYNCSANQFILAEARILEVLNFNISYSTIYDEFENIMGLIELKFPGLVQISPDDIKLFLIKIIINVEFKSTEQTILICALFLNLVKPRINETSDNIVVSKLHFNNISKYLLNFLKEKYGKNMETILATARKDIKYLFI